MTTRVKGGAKLKAYIAQQKKLAAKLESKTVSAGFHDRADSRVAAINEFGDSEGNIPERPLFRHGIFNIVDSPAVHNELVDLAKGHGSMQRLADLAADELKRAYKAPGISVASLSPSRVAQKGHAKPLIGERGPILVDRIEGRVK